MFTLESTGSIGVDLLFLRITMQGEHYFLLFPALFLLESGAFCWDRFFLLLLFLLVFLKVPKFTFIIHK